VLGTGKDPRFTLANTVPDRMEEGGTLVYVKREPALWLNDQIGLVIEACRAHGKRFRLVVPRGASISQGLRESLAATDRFAGLEEADAPEDAGLYLTVLDRGHEIDYGGIEVGAGACSTGTAGRSTGVSRSASCAGRPSGAGSRSS
jgi:hypothetical protein